jgi:ABC-2 type transport system ATP-binding protein
MTSEISMTSKSETRTMRTKMNVSEDAMPLLSVDKITKSYGEIKALEDISLELSPGEIVGLAGPNGAGKSTMFKILAGLVYPNSGTSTICGFSRSLSPREYAKRLGVLIEAPAFYPNMTAEDHLTYIARIRKCHSREAIRQILDRVGLKEHRSRRVEIFSTGMKQRLAIGMAMIHNPQVLLLDEPTNGLDPAAVIEMRSIIKDLVKTGETGVLISTHLLHEIEQVCDRVLFLQRGKLISSHTLRSSTKEMLCTICFETNAADQAANIISRTNSIQKPIIVNASTVECRLSRCEVPLAVADLVKNNIAVYQVFEKQESLEELYIHTLGASHNVE